MFGLRVVAYVIGLGWLYRLLVVHFARGFEPFPLITAASFIIPLAWVLFIGEVEAWRLSPLPKTNP